MNKSKIVSNSNDRYVSGQLLIVGACTIAFVVITAAAVSLNFNNSVRVISERTHPLVYEFRDVRDKMEQALKDRDSAQGWDDTTMEALIISEFSDIFDDFSRIELYHGIHFYYDVSSVNVNYDVNEVESIEAVIIMIQKNSQISGLVTFQIQ